MADAVDFGSLFSQAKHKTPRPDGSASKGKAKQRRPRSTDESAKPSDAKLKPHKQAVRMQDVASTHNGSLPGDITSKKARGASAASISKNRKRKQRKRNGGLQQVESAAAQPTEGTHPRPSVRTPLDRAAQLRDKMQSQLMGARFREINERLYTINSAEAQALFQSEPHLFEAYHEGFRLQAKRWPTRPVDVIIEWLDAQPPLWVVADMGCGDAEISARVKQTVHSFDLLPTNERVTACDVANVPLSDSSLDAVVFCLSLMGANYADFLREAHRLLKPRGALVIAEVTSRFDGGVAEWVHMLRRLGFDLDGRDESNSHFVLFNFVKSKRKVAEVELVPLKACLYKRR